MQSEAPLDEHVNKVLQSWCLRELAFWRTTTLDSRAAFENLADANRTFRSVFLLDISEGTVHIGDKPEFYQRRELDDPEHSPVIGRIHHYKRLIERTIAFSGLDLRTVVAVDVGDKPSARFDRPIFGFQKERNNPAILLPDIDFLLNDFYQKQGFHDGVPYECKSTSAIFIGATTGVGLITKKAVIDLTVPRIRSAMYFKGIQDVEFRLPVIAQCDSPETIDLIRSLGISGERVPYAAQFNHKFIISMDGNGATCSRVALALGSNCVLLKYESPHMLYYFDRLIPWAHYIPIVRDQDVEKVIFLERENPGIFAFIAQASADFYARYLSIPMVLRYTAMILETYVQRFPLEAQYCSVDGPSDESCLDTTPQILACDSLVHIQNEGDVWFRSSQWNGRRGSCLWIEGFSLYPYDQYVDQHLEYQVMFAGGIESEWYKCGQFCGTRGKGIPLIGINIRLNGPESHRYKYSYTATCVNGDITDPVQGGQWCNGNNQSALEAFSISIAQLPELTPD